MLRIVAVVVLPIFLSLWLIECHSKSKPSSKPSIIGVYQYSAYDKNGNKIGEGQLEVTSIESNRIKGQWRLRAVGNPQNVGPQVGNGAFEGTIEQDSVSINLNPNMADNNVTLAGKLDGARLRGSWSFSGFAGVISQGTFEATKK